MPKTKIYTTIYPSIVTYMGNWQKMITDVNRLGIFEISLFLTGAKITERRKIYEELKKSKVKKIPHVHARHDMREEELDFLVNTFKTKAFTIHFPYIKHFKGSQHIKKLFIENNPRSQKIKSMGSLKKVGGLCIDLSHQKEYEGYSQELFDLTNKTIEKFPVGCNHMSAVRPDGKAWHYAKNKHEFDYVANMDKKYFSDNVNIEVGNSIAEQLEFKEYVVKMLSKKFK
jgi:hypothetical protein